MKIAAKAIERYLAQPDPAHRASLFYGPDSGLARDRAKRLLQTYLGKDYDPFALAEPAEAQLLADPALLADELAAIHMMAPRRVILVRDASDKLTKVIESAAEHFHAAALLIVIADELSARSSLRGWFEKSPVAAAIACYRDEVRDVQAVIRQRFEDAGINAGREVTDYLAGQLGNDRYVTYQELEKLVTYAGEEKTLALAEAQALVDYNRETSFDDMVSAAADRSLTALEKNLALLLREGAQPVAYLRALQRYFNRLFFIRGQMEKGQSADQVIAGLRPPVFFKQVPLLTRHANSWSSEALAKALKLLAEAELACKTSDLPPVPACGRKLLQLTQLR